jgi:N-acetyl-anhydromuramyl-L-alanine amidase AmpD
MPAEYPPAAWHPLAGHFAPGRRSQRDLIVLHITAGSTATGAIATFEHSKPPNRTSAHFIVDRDGRVTQLVSIDNTAWHASAVNSRSIGVEHVAVPGKLLPTEAQCAASSALVAWLCRELCISCDRAHIRSHHEASPRDGHVGCCAPTLDPDRIVAAAAALLSNTAAQPPERTA